MPTSADALYGKMLSYLFDSTYQPTADGMIILGSGVISGPGTFNVTSTQQVCCCTPPVYLCMAHWYKCNLAIWCWLGDAGRHYIRLLLDLVKEPLLLALPARRAA